MHVFGGALGFNEAEAVQPRRGPATVVENVTDLELQ